ncbi:Oxidoreductase family, NAD-binding Rossmann fold [Rhizoctonia solani]|uniref:D-xylose 1-dehydrogenase (NADP(+), D-xylono-1,5-lactone-forming) n=1 Tax=Rhizoctonia solani TaxID=456999 RepID=A0A8H7IIB6_9AGAM|nr:Oxidoreductase family, NAD-binding Rossmann fold [Rhizoctonia solani]
MSDSNKFTLRWGILATGGIAEAFAKDLLADPAARDTHDVVHKIVAVVGADSSVIACGSYDELVNIKEVDIIYIATPHSHHYENGLLALEAGKHVLCEASPSQTCAKAFTVNARQAAHLAKVAQAKKLFLMEAVWTRFFPISKEIQRLIHEEKVLGEIRRVFADLSMVFKRDPNSRLYSPELAGGALLDLGIYPFTWAFMTLHDHPDNQKTKPSVTASILKSQLTPVDETTSVTLTFPKLHATAHLTCSMTSKIVKPYCVTIQGEKGELQVAPAPYRPEQFVLSLYDQEPKTFDFKIPGQGLFWEADECARQIRDGKLQSEILVARQSMDQIKRHLIIQPFAMNRIGFHSAKSTVRLIPSAARNIHSSRWALKPITNSSINPDEIAHFSRLSSQWWDESDGAEFALLHRMNPVRVQWILEKLEEARKDDAKDEWTDWRSPAKVQAPKVGRQLEGMSVLDVGCGGGLLSETLSRLGARTTGIDASQNNIHIATLHASEDPSFVSGENHLEYKHTSAEALVGKEAQFDVVCAMEVVEHVDNPAEFLRIVGSWSK